MMIFHIRALIPKDMAVFLEEKCQSCLGLCQSRKVYSESSVDGLEPVCSFIFSQPDKLSNWDMDRFTDPSLQIDAGIINILRNYIVYLEVSGGGI